MYDTKQSYLDGVIKCHQPTNTTGGHHPVAFSEHFPATFSPLVKPTEPLAPSPPTRAAGSGVHPNAVGRFPEARRPGASVRSKLYGNWYGGFPDMVSNSWMVYNRKSHLWMDDLGLPPFQEMPIYGMMWAEYQPIL